MSESWNTIDEVCREIWLTAKDWEPNRESVVGITRLVNVNGEETAIGIAYVRETFVPYIHTNGNVCFGIANGDMAHVIKTGESLIGAYGYQNVHQAANALSRIANNYQNGRY